jgi:hypothetical protein
MMANALVYLSHRGVRHCIGAGTTTTAPTTKRYWLQWGRVLLLCQHTRITMKISLPNHVFDSFKRFLMTTSECG